MSEKAYSERLARCIESIGVTEVIRSSFAEGRVTVLFRVTSKFQDGKLDERPLLLALERLILHDPEGSGPWLCHVCSQLLPKKIEDGTWRMVKGWNVSISSKDFDNDLNTVSRLLRGIEIAKTPLKKNVTVTGSTEIEVIPLVGAGPSRTSSPKDNKGKGAWTVGGSDDFNLTADIKRR